MARFSSFRTGGVHVVWLKTLAAASLFFLAAPNVRAGMFEKVTVSTFDSFRTSAYPCVDRLADGRLLCVFSAMGEASGNKMVVAGCFSEDHGRTWGKPRILIDTPDHFDYDPAIIVAGDRVIVTSTTCPADHHNLITTSITLAVRSDDNGATWSKPYKIDMGHRYTSGKVNNGVVLRDGSVLFGYTWEAQLDKVESIPTEGDMIERSGVMISTDQGLTWKQGGDSIDDSLKDPARKTAIAGTCEPAIAECSDGSVYMLMRTGVDHLYEARSTDGGKNWSKPVKSALTGHNAPAALCRFKDRREGILAIWNNSPEVRWPLCVAASFDDAKTWTVPRVVANTPGFQCSYPGCIQAADGTLILVWQQDSKQGREILSARIDEAWLLDEPRTDAAIRGTALLPARTEIRGPLRVSLGDARVVMRGPMFPRAAGFSDRTVIINADKAEEGGVSTSVISEDHGQHWRPFSKGLTEGAGANATELDDGSAVALAWDTKPRDGEPGAWATTRWISRDHGRTAEGPLTDGTLSLPPDQFSDKQPQWFHGNIIRLASGDLIAAMQGREDDPHKSFRSFVSRSADGGKTWQFLSLVAAVDTIDDPHGLTRTGWRQHGPCEPAILELDDGRLLCVMRLINDDARPLLDDAAASFHDLTSTISGDGIYPTVLKLPADRYVGPAAAATPLIASFSSDAGRTWSRARPISPARGCFPRLQRLGNVIALSYGALSYPRWGNAITFSHDGGATWTEEIIVAPTLTTGYTDLVKLGEDRLLYVFDATPPQPWANHPAHWIGVTDIQVTREAVPSPDDAQLNVSAAAMPRPDESWVKRHHAISARARQGQVDIVFLGDSITHRWDSAGKTVWEQFYGPRNALNAGIDGDGTQTVLWRIQNGNLDGIQPRVAVLMIGTNNSTDPRQSPPDIADAIGAIVRELRMRLPGTRVLLLSIFPRGQSVTPERERGAEASRLAASLADDLHVFSLDIGDAFLNPDGTISAEIMPDYLHLSEAGYLRWARAMEPTLARLLDAE